MYPKEGVFYMMPIIGDKACLKDSFSVSDVIQFAHLVGDHNPLNLDEDYAKSSRFGRTIVHGMLPAALISALIATKLPGPGSIYLSQTLNFSSPVYPGEIIEAEVEVLEIKADKSVIRLRTTCTKLDGTVTINGEALVLYDPPHQKD